MNSFRALALSVICTAAILALSGCEQSGGPSEAPAQPAANTAPAEAAEAGESLPAPEVVEPEAPETPEIPAPSGEEAAGGLAASTDVSAVAAPPQRAKPRRNNAIGAVNKEVGLSPRGQEAPDDEGDSEPTNLNVSAEGLSPAPTGQSQKTNSAVRDLRNQKTPPTGSQMTNIRRPAVEPVTTPGATPGAVMIYPEPTKLDLGQIATADAGTGNIQLVNRGDEPRTLVECKKSCGCTTVNCPKGRVIQPGESVEIEIRMNGGTRPTKLNKTVTFLLSDGHPPVRINVMAEAVSYVTIQPEILDKTRNEDGRIVMAAIDDQPFTIKSMYPPVIEQFDTEPKTTHEIVFDWAKWEELGQQRKLMFSLDHPKCSKLYGTIDPRSIDRSKMAPQDPRAPQPPRAPDIGRLIKQDNIDEALRLIDEGEIDVESVDRAGKTPLLVASELGSVEVMQALLDASADVEAGDKVGRTSLMWAAQSKNAEAVLLLLDAGADFTAKDNIGNTAISWACGFGDAASVQALIDAGASIEVTGAVGGFTPIIWAAGFGEADTLRILIDAGADIDSGDMLQGATPLMHAVRTNRPDNVKLLLEAGADLESRDHRGQTPFLVAAANSGADTAMLTLLLEAGANPNDVNEAGDNALVLARKRSDLRAAAVIAMLEELLGVEPEPTEGEPAGDAGDSGSDGG